MSKHRTALVVIDPQNCFMDLEGAPLAVPGAVADMKRLKDFIVRDSFFLGKIFVSLDTHMPDHISHPERWINENDEFPCPFTAITYEDCLSGLWRAYNPADQKWQLEYLDRLNRTHLIWPVHGQKPAWEWQIEVTIASVLARFPDRLCFVEKGMHRDVEQFGIFGAEVPFPGAPQTDINHALIAEIDAYDRVVFAGVASSHCVMDSVKQFLEHMPSQDPTKMVLLKDCMSPVTGFEQLAANWLDAMDAIGVHVINSTDFQK